MRRDGEMESVLQCWIVILVHASSAPGSSSRSQLEIVFMESVNFPQILSSPDAEIKLKNSRFHKLNKCGWKADTVFWHTPGKITSTFSDCQYSACNAMCNWKLCRFAVVCAVVYDSLVPRAILSPLS